MKEGRTAEGAHILRARIDMVRSWRVVQYSMLTTPRRQQRRRLRVWTLTPAPAAAVAWQGHANMKMRDPPLMRVKHGAHYRLGTSVSLYPMYALSLRALRTAASRTRAPFL